MLEMWHCLQARLGCREVEEAPLSTGRLEVHNRGSDVLSKQKTCDKLRALRSLQKDMGPFEDSGPRVRKALGLACVCSARLPDSLAVL